MNKFEGVLIASDFDGTFADSNGNTVPRNIEKIRYFMRNGGKFTVCTGRTYQGFKKYNREYINAPVLLCNGAMAYDYERKSIAFINGMGENALKLANDIVNYSKETGIELYPFNDTYVINPTEENRNHLEWQFVKYTEKKNAENIPLPIAKMMINASHSELEYIYENFIIKYDDIDIIKGFNNWMEIIAKGFDKGTGLICLGEKLNIAKDNIYAVGDGYNDIDMLKCAKLSFAPSNADKNVLKVADITVCGNDDGCIADVIEYLDGVY